MAERQPGEKLTNDDVEALVGDMIDESRQFIEDDLSQLREKATDYYKSEKFDNEEEGRSQVVTSDVRDVVKALMPSLLRIFTGPERQVEFKPRTAEDREFAEQATDTVNFYVLERNEGFLQTHAVLKDALTRKLGFMKWWWDDVPEVRETEYTGLSDEDLASLLQEDDDIEMTIIESDTEGTDAVVKKILSNGRLGMGAIPPEEMSWNKSARSLEHAQIVTHTSDRTLDEMLAMGFPLEDLEDALGGSRELLDSPETAARHISEDPDPDDEARDWWTRPIRHDEAYVRLNIEGVVERDEDDDDNEVTARRYRVHMVGDNHKLLGDPEPVSHVPFAVFSPDPEPHTIVGMCPADDAMDIQDIASAVLRGTLDSLSLSIDPGQEVVDGQVNTKDLLNSEMGRYVRVKQPGMLREIAHRFVGGDSLPFLDWLSELKDKRTGLPKASQGLDADALQSTTKAAVAATISGAQQRIELIARVLAETGFKTLFRGMLMTITEHQDEELVIRLRNKEYVNVDPRKWDATMDVVVNVALGVGLPEERLQLLQAINAKQEQILGTLGPGNPVVSLSQYTNGLHRMVEMGGWNNPGEFFTRISEQQEAELNKAAEEAMQNKPPEGADPAAMAIAQAEMAKVQVQAQKNEADMQLKQQELEIRLREIDLRDDRERDKQAAEIALTIQKLEIEQSNSVDRDVIQGDITMARASLESDTRIATARIQADAKGRSDNDGG